MRARQWRLKQYKTAHACVNAFTDQQQTSDEIPGHRAALDALATPFRESFDTLATELVVGEVASPRVALAVTNTCSGQTPIAFPDTGLLILCSPIPRQGHRISLAIALQPLFTREALLEVLIDETSVFSNRTALARSATLLILILGSLASGTAGRSGQSTEEVLGAVQASRTAVDGSVFANLAHGASLLTAGSGAEGARLTRRARTQTLSIGEAAGRTINARGVGRVVAEFAQLARQTSDTTLNLGIRS